MVTQEIAHDRAMDCSAKKAVTLRMLPDGNIVAGIKITIDNSVIDRYLNERLGNDLIATVGIHTVYILHSLVSDKRLQLEFVALCELTNISTKVLTKHPELINLPNLKIKTNHSFILALSYAAFRKFQCLVVGHNIHSAMQLPENVSYQHAMYFNEDYGFIDMPTEAEKDFLAERTRFTTDIQRSMNLHLYEDDEGEMKVKEALIKYDKFFYLECA